MKLWSSFDPDYIEGKFNEYLESLPAGYSPEMMKNLYENCRIEYHGIEQALWEP